MSIFNDFSFAWSAVVTTLFFLLCGSISMFTLTKEKSYRFYIFYALSALFSLVVRVAITHNFEIFPKVTEKYLPNIYYLCDVWLYLFYTIFTIHFLDLLDTPAKKTLLLIEKMAKNVILFAFILFLASVLLFAENELFFETIHHYVFAPILILQAFYITYVALKNANRIRSVFIFGLMVFIAMSILGYVLDLLQIKFLFSDNAVFFFLGAIIENICFAAGIAFKFKNNIEEVELHKREAQANLMNKEIGHLKGMIEGEKGLLDKMSTNYYKKVLRLLSSSLVYFEKEYKEASTSQNLKKGIESLQEAIYSISDLRRYFPNPDAENISFLDKVCRLAFFFCKHNYTIENDYGQFQFSENVKFVLLKILEEFLENVKEHANANEVQIIFDEIEENFVLIVKDDGIGFQEIDQLEGVGLKSVQTIVDALLGKLSILSAPKGGTIVEVQLPLKELENLN